MKFQTLCSGSKGNCAVLTGGGATVLIDLGMSVPALEKALGERNIKPEKIDAVFITHEHTDHISGLDAFSKKYGKKVFVHEKGFLETAKKLYWTNHRLTSFGDGSFAFKGLTVSSFRCPHDSAYCCGYRFDDGTASVATVLWTQNLKTPTPILPPKMKRRWKKTSPPRGRKEKDGLLISGGRIA